MCIIVMLVIATIGIMICVDAFFAAIEKSNREMQLRDWKELDEALSDDDWWLCCESAILYWKSRL